MPSFALLNQNTTLVCLTHPPLLVNYAIWYFPGLKPNNIPVYCTSFEYMHVKHWYLYSMYLF